MEDKGLCILSSETACIVTPKPPLQFPLGNGTVIASAASITPQIHFHITAFYKHQQSQTDFDDNLYSDVIPDSDFIPHCQQYPGGLFY